MIDGVQSWTLGGLFLAGLAGSAHCLGMCAPWMAAFSTLEPASSRAKRWTRRAAYHAGRLWTYAVLGALAGGLGAGVDAATRRLAQGVLPAAAALGIAALATIGFLPGLRGGGAFGRVWQRLGGIARRLRATPGPGSQLLAGALHGLLPCGLVYWMLVPAATLGSIGGGAIGMAAFGAGTVPALWLVQAFSSTLAPVVRRSRRLAAVCFAVAAIALVWRVSAVPAVAHDPGSHDAHAAQTEQAAHGPVCHPTE